MSILVRLVGVHQADHLLVAESLQVLELSHGSLITLRGIFVEGLDRVDLAVLVDVGSNGKAALGNLRHEVEASKTLGLDLQCPQCLPWPESVGEHRRTQLWRILSWESSRCLRGWMGWTIRIGSWPGHGTCSHGWDGG